MSFITDLFNLSYGFFSSDFMLRVLWIGVSVSLAFFFCYIINLLHFSRRI